MRDKIGKLVFALGVGGIIFAGWNSAKMRSDGSSAPVVKAVEAKSDDGILTGLASSIPPWVYWTVLILDLLAGYVVLMSISYWVLINVWGWRRWSKAGTLMTDGEAFNECLSYVWSILAPLTLAFAALWWLWHRVQRVLDSTQEKKPPKQEVE